MPWLRSHSELRNHPKTLKAARLLGVSTPQVVGHLHMLWWWVMDYAPSGDLSDFAAADIAVGAGWDGDPEEFVEALVSSGMGLRAGFLERDEHGGLTVHDWSQHGGRDIDERRAAVDRKRQWRAVKKDECHGDATRGGTVANENATGTPRVAGHIATEPPQVRGEERRGEEKRGEEKRRQETLANSPAPSGAEEPRNRKTIPYQEIVDAYHETLPMLPRIREMTDQRRKAIAARWGSSPERQNLEWWRQYYHAVAESGFLLGENERGWVASFDFLLREQKMVMVLEGRYRSRQRPRNPRLDDFPDMDELEA
ncbi:MAG TPA: hypothetical protein PK535_08845 [Synergistaceae bacterium]|nr:hypothetical protein [Synergistaceae bacterium]